MLGFISHLPQYVFMAWYAVKDRNDPTLLLLLLLLLLLPPHLHLLPRLRMRGAIPPLPY
jgi:hypothetical protein